MNRESNTAASWRDSLEDIKSLGSQDAGPGSLAGLHEARKRHNSQYFTPLAVVRVAWQAAMQAAGTVLDKRRVSLLDNSIGTGRMLHYATAEHFSIAGLDIHGDVIERVTAAAELAGFDCEVWSRGMQEAQPKGFDIALVNPPFSIHLESPTLKPYDCTTWGRFGKNTSAQSDDYAICQALDAARVVVAIVPNSLAESVMQGGVVGEEAARLRAVVRLGRRAFEEEGADVETSILIFGAEPGAFLGEFKPDDLDAFALPSLGLKLEQHVGKSRLRVIGMSAEEPVVTMAVTGDQTVRVVHSGRKIHLLFNCGLVQAKVLNAVYRARVYSSDILKLAKGIKYAGQGVLDVQNLLVREDPEMELGGLAKTIELAGGKAQIDSGLLNHLRKLVKRRGRATAPFGHWVFKGKQSDSIKGRAARSIALVPKSWTTPVIKAGEEATLVRVPEGWTVSKGGHTLTFTEQEAQTVFNLPMLDAGWVEVHKPLQARFPAIARDFEARARRLNLDKLLWKFQFDDLVEVSMRPGGAVLGLQQGLGKARLSAGLVLLRNIKHGLIAMPSYLTGEYINRLVDAGLDPAIWQVITKPEHILDLKRINVISYERLRMPVRRRADVAGCGESTQGEVDDLSMEDGDKEAETVQGGSRRGGPTYAKMLRHRVRMVVCDEGEILANPKSQRSAAIAQLSADVCIVSSGTPMGNYPRDLLPIAAATVGDGVVGNPYGIKQPMLEETNARSVQYTESGIESFRKQFVSVVWVTREFQETLLEGAKREVPAVKDVAGYRKWAGGFVKRRLHREPEVEACVKIADPIKETIEVEWSDKHLSYYLAVADEFAEWFKKTDPTKRANNLMLLLARISAVEGACNVPQREKKTGPAWSGGMTSKQIAIAEKSISLAEEGHKIVVFAESPKLLRVLKRAIEEGGVEAVEYHGEMSKKQRATALDSRFRYGSAKILLASKGVTQAGLDLYQADRAIMADRSWSAREEDQAIRRLLRPQQERTVVVSHMHLKGAIDCYQAQMVLWKQTASDCGLDWGDPMSDDVEFEHLDSILGRFVEDLAKLRGMKVGDFREMMRKAA